MEAAEKEILNAEDEAARNNPEETFSQLELDDILFMIVTSKKNKRNGSELKKDSNPKTRREKLWRME